MKISKINRIWGRRKVCDCCVGDGYVKAHHGSLPDIDTDFDADRRDEVKAYLEKRYNKVGLQRVFSAGTFTTAKVKSAIKDVARTHRIPVPTTNYLTAILDDNMSWTDLMKLASTDKRLRDYIGKYPEVFEEMLPIMGQPRSAGIHASAVIITPEHVKGKRVECFDLLPVRKMGDLLVSEISGNDIDAIGILKNDVLGIKELTRISNVLKLIEREYGITYTVHEIATKYLNDPKVFEILREGRTQGVFQISGEGLTKYVKRVAPDNINDLIASVALFRPATLASGSAEKYVECKRGYTEPTYLWGTYNAMKNTFGILCYQEQLTIIATEVGGFTLTEGVNLAKMISKKKIDKIKAQKEKFMAGAKKNGCPDDAAKAIWDMFEAAGSYLFNASHAATYSLTAYVDAWLKTYYPTAFYTAVLRDQDEDKLPVLLSEIRNTSETQLEQPDINISDVNFVPDFKKNKIYWSISRVRQLGPKAVKWILDERRLYGSFYDMDDFISRIFKGKLRGKKEAAAEGEELSGRCPVTSRILKHLILAGAFDNVEHISRPSERYGLLMRADALLQFGMSEEEFPASLIDKDYFWCQKQIAVSGIGAIDYKAVLDGQEEAAGIKQPFIHLKDLNNMFYDVKRGVVCATICSVADKSYKDKETGETKHFGKIDVQQNSEMNVLTIWDDWSQLKGQLKDAVGKIMAAVVNVKWSDYDEKNVLQINKSSLFKLI